MYPKSATEKNKSYFLSGEKREGIAALGLGSTRGAPAPLPAPVLAKPLPQPGPCHPRARPTGLDAALPRPRRPLTCRPLEKGQRSTRCARRRSRLMMGAGRGCAAPRLGSASAPARPGPPRPPLARHAGRAPPARVKGEGARLPDGRRRRAPEGGWAGAGRGREEAGAGRARRGRAGAGPGKGRAWRGRAGEGGGEGREARGRGGRGARRGAGAAHALPPASAPRPPCPLVRGLAGPTTGERAQGGVWRTGAAQRTRPGGGQRLRVSPCVKELLHIRSKSPFLRASCLETRLCGPPPLSGTERLLPQAPAQPLAALQSLDPALWNGSAQPRGLGDVHMSQSFLSTGAWPKTRTSHFLEGVWVD